MVEYEVAARLAWDSGHKDMAEELLAFAEVEWVHEDYFYKKVSSHFLFPFFPKWDRPGERSQIRNRFQCYEK